MKTLSLFAFLSLAPAVAFAQAAPAKAPTKAATPAPAKAAAPAATPATPPAAAPSCGQMIASKAVLPAKMAELMTAVAETMDAHAALMIAGKTKEGAKEAKGLKKIAADHRALAKAMAKAQASMEAAAKWPNAPHDMATMMGDAKLMASMQKMLAAEKEMVALMQKDLAEMEAMHKHK
jgi:hypothetical protein